jgi:hypothetical protein
MVKLFIDDERQPPNAGWLVARNFENAVAIMTQYRDTLTDVSFDNDLGLRLEGRDALKFLVDNAIAVTHINIHSQNHIAERWMLDYVQQAMRLHVYPEVKLTTIKFLEG